MALALAGPRHGAVHRSVRDMAVAGVRWRLEREREEEEFVPGRGRAWQASFVSTRLCACPASPLRSSRAAGRGGQACTGAQQAG